MYPSIRRRLVLVVTAAIMAVSLPASATEADGRGPFVDTDGSMFEASVAAIWAADLTAGCEPWYFCPDASVTREEMAAFLTRALGLTVPATVNFTDTAESLFTGEIEAIAEAGITAGCGDRLFCPDDPVTRAQMASFFARAFDLPPSGENPFGDDDSSVHAADIAAIAAAGITHGCGPGRFCPEDPVTRDEMAAFLTRALGLLPPDEMPLIPADIRADYLAELSAPPWPTGPGAEGWRTLVEQYFEPGDVDKAIRIIACESHGDPNARNRSSGASGLFQHIPRYWPERSRGAGFAGASVFDPVANVGVAAWLVYDYPAGGWKHWVCKG